MLYVKDCKYTTAMSSQKIVIIFNIYLYIIIYSIIRGHFRAKKSREFPGFPGTPLKIPVSREFQNGREIGNTSVCIPVYTIV